MKRSARARAGCGPHTRVQPVLVAPLDDQEESIELNKKRKKEGRRRQGQDEDVLRQFVSKLKQVAPRGKNIFRVYFSSVVERGGVSRED